MKLKELINRCNINQVVNRVIELYPNQDGFQEEYTKLIKTLQGITPSQESLNKNRLMVYVTHVWQCFSADESEVEEYDGVSGYNYDDNINYGLEFCPFEEWLAFDVCENSLEHYGEDDFLAHILWEMSFVSFDEAEIQEEADNLNKLSEEVHKAIESGDESKFVTHVLDDNYVRFTDKDREVMAKYDKLTQDFKKDILGI